VKSLKSRIQIREPFNGISHLAAALASAAGLVVILLVNRNGLLTQISLLIYGVTLILMFSASAAYHLVPAGDRLNLLLRRLDHSAIYLLIAGTYTPICIHFFEGAWRTGLLAVIWLMAVSGIAVKVFFINAKRWITAGIYLLMGWLSIAAIRQMLAAMPAGALVWLAAGGIFFTIGAVIYMLKRPNLFPPVFGFHEMWHIFVILGCLSHFIVISRYVAAG
jgi:hemolysin III